MHKQDVQFTWSDMSLHKGQTRAGRWTQPKQSQVPQTVQFGELALLCANSPVPWHHPSRAEKLPRQENSSRGSPCASQHRGTEILPVPNLSLRVVNTGSRRTGSTEGEKQVLIATEQAHRGVHVITVLCTARLTWGSSLFYQLSLHLHQCNTISTGQQPPGWWRWMERCQIICPEVIRVLLPQPERLRLVGKEMLSFKNRKISSKIRNAFLFFRSSANCDK